MVSEVVGEGVLPGLCPPHLDGACEEDVGLGEVQVGVGGVADVHGRLLYPQEARVGGVVAWGGPRVPSGRQDGSGGA